MAKKLSTRYWVFQANPKQFQLREALRAEMLYHYPVKSHIDKIEPGDRVILWQTGKNAGTYALATVMTPVEKYPLSAAEQRFYKGGAKEDSLKVGLRVDYNLWSRPITSDMLGSNPVFKTFNAGSGGTNLKATKAQYEELENMVRQFDLVEEPTENYQPRQPPPLPLNVVLYGPPGTGKTYHTINYALSIVENRPLEELLKEDRQVLRGRYHKYFDEGLIHFVSFHQSFSYEDFVEGIKPHTSEGKVVYEIEDGIFKHLCIEAKRNIVESLISILPKKEIRMEFNRLYTAFLEYLQSAEFETFNTRSNIKMYLHRVLRNGNLTLRREKSFTRLTISKTRLRKVYNQLPGGVQLSNEAQQKIKDSIKEVNKRAFWAVFDELKKFEMRYIEQLQQEVQEQTLDDEELGHFDLSDFERQAADQSNRYVLIIDEINRGNVAAIFGDLISIIEEDKREGRSEGTLVLLPYSKTFLCVPPNLHIVATMNTADRSLDKLDLALRRRFTFIEMKPQPEVIEQLGLHPTVGNIDLAALLQAINQRIELLLGTDYLIGHSYFMNIANLYELRALFERQLIPLLEQYFYGDLSKIGLVLGEDFVKRKALPADGLFARFEEEQAEELIEKRLFEISPSNSWDAEAFVRIYQQ